MPSAPDARPQRTRSLHRAVGLLRLLASHTRIGWRLSDLAEHAGLDPATVHRLLQALVDDGLASRVPGTRHYTLGPLAFELGLAAAPYYDLGRDTQAPLAALAQALRGTVFLKLRSGVESVCLARHDGVGPVPSLMLDVGGRRPLCLTAGGVAMLIHLPRAEQALIEAHNRRTIGRLGAARWRAARQMLQRSRALGYASNLGDIAAGINAIGVPLYTPAGEPVASLTLALAGASLAPAEAIAQRLRKEGDAIAPLLGRLRLGCAH
ncbi:IclR family transcriptional regulator [Comamonadaceae bacterium G21597-S1]|nr:IclR family transcriptional regulator [Comamonadaceae bacterium G21597-S1]